MGNFSDYLEQKLLGVTLLGSAFTEVETVYLALATSISTVGSELSVFTEVASGLGYDRIRAEFTPPTSGPTFTSVNTNTITFSPATTPWGDVAHFGVYDGDVIGAGNLLYWGDLTASRTVETDDVIEFQYGKLTIRLA